MHPQHLSPELERLLAQVPEAEIREWLTQKYPHLVKEDRKARALAALARIDELAKKARPLRDPMEVLREIREADYLNGEE